MHNFEKHWAITLVADALAGILGKPMAVFGFVELVQEIVVFITSSAETIMQTFQVSFSLVSMAATAQYPQCFSKCDALKDRFAMAAVSRHK